MQFSFRNIFLILGLFTSAGPLHAQFTMEWQLVDSIGEWPVDPPVEMVADSMTGQQLAGDFVRTLWDESYLLASLDSIWLRDSFFVARVYVGPEVFWETLQNGNVPDEIWKKAGITSKDYTVRRNPGYTRSRLFQEKMLRLYEESGYPFARIQLDSIQLEGLRMSARLTVDPGARITFGKLEMEGDARINTAYLENYLGVQPGTPYQRSRILELRDRLQELPFLEEKQRPQIIFRGPEAIVQLVLERRRASRFDFLIGVQPSGQPGVDRNFLITGKLEAEFWNQFGRGERMFTKFERLRPGTQSLDLGFTYPYLLNLPFGVDVGFRQYRFDSTFNDVAIDLGVRYLFTGENYLEAYWNRIGSNLLSVNQEILLATRQLPENLDYRTTSFGLELQLEGLDYRFNPRRGARLLARSGVGNKEIIRNSLITSLSDPGDPAFDFEVLYDSLAERSLQINSQVQFEYFIPLFAASTIRAAFKGGWVYSETPVFRNEQFRIGGIKVLRGFDEESLFATRYGVFTLEYRLLSGQNSNFFVFGDYGYVEDIRATQKNIDRPYGFGGGITFETAAGLFSLSLAVGGQTNVSPDFRNPKVHLGYLSIF